MTPIFYLNEVYSDLGKSTSFLKIPREGMHYLYLTYFIPFQLKFEVGLIFINFALIIILY